MMIAFVDDGVEKYWPFTTSIVNEITVTKATGKNLFVFFILYLAKVNLKQNSLMSNYLFETSIKIL
jgi:hypothetical protein